MGSAREAVQTAPPASDQTAGGSVLDAEPLGTVPLYSSLDTLDGGADAGDTVLARGDVGTVTTNAGTTGYGISYHGGPVLHGPVSAYYIWYGNWSNSFAPTVLGTLVSNLGGSLYYNIDITYGDSTGASVANSVRLGGTVNDNYSLGTALADADIQTLVANHINRGDLPLDPNGVYFVLTSSDVNETGGFCTTYCAWHNHGTINGADIKVAFVGDPDCCPKDCEPGQGSAAYAPNGDAGDDAMASTIAYELEVTANDPDLNAWYDDSQNLESAGKCANTYGTTYKVASGALANVHLGNRDYLLQQNWLNVSPGSCALAYDDFTLSASQSPLTLPPNSYGSSSVAVGGVGPVSLKVSVPGTIVATFSNTGTDTTSIQAGQSATVSLYVAPGTSAGTYTVTVTGTEGSITHSTTVTVTVPPPDFSISASPSTLSVAQASSGTSTLTTVAMNGSGSVSFAVSAPSGITATLELRSAYGANTSSTLTVAVGASTAPGTYTLTITGTEGSITHSIPITLNVSAADFTLSASSSSLTMSQGGSRTVTVSTTAVNGTGSVSLAAGAASDIYATFTPNTVAATGRSTLTVGVSANITPGTYSITVTGNDGSVTRSITVTLYVLAADFTLSASPSSLTVPQGGSRTVTISSTGVSGSGTISLAADGVVGVNATLDSTPIPSQRELHTHSRREREYARRHVYHHHLWHRRERHRIDHRHRHRVGARLHHLRESG